MKTMMTCRDTIGLLIAFLAALALQGRSGATPPPALTGTLLVDDVEGERPSIGLIGLGGMGVAVAKCLIRHGYTVHAWNRSPKQLQELGLVEEARKEHLHIHQTPTEVFAATGTTFFIINSPPHLQAVVDIIVQSSPSQQGVDHVLKGKTIVNMVNHDPYAAKDLENEVLKKFGIHHVSASLFGVPETVCTPGAQLLVSAPPRSTSSIRRYHTQETPDRTAASLPQHLTALGRVDEFVGDVGLASVVYLSLVQSLYFGLAGYELALLILTKYMARETNLFDSGDGTPPGDTAVDTLQRFQELASNLLTTYIPAFLPIISNTINRQQWKRSYVPASAAVTLFEMHDVVFERLGLLQNSFHATYLDYLRKVVETEGDETGISAVVQHYSTDGFRIENTAASNREQNNFDTEEL